MTSAVFDVFALLIIGVNIVLGLRYGVVGRMLAFAGTFGAVGAATYAANSFERAVNGRGHPDNLVASAWTYIAVLGVVMIMVEVLVALYRERIHKLFSLMFDRVVGAGVGLVLGVLEVGLAVLVAYAVGTATPDDRHALPPQRTTAQDAIQGAPVTGSIARLNPEVRGLYKPVLPDDLSNYLRENTAP